MEGVSPSGHCSCKHTVHYENFNNDFLPSKVIRSYILSPSHTLLTLQGKYLTANSCPRMLAGWRLLNCSMWKSVRLQL